MLGLADFPPEIILAVLSFLPISALSSFRQTSQRWNSFFVANEAYIYRNACYHHSFIPTPEALPESASEGDKKSWYQLCRSRYTIEGRWIGRHDPWCQKLCGNVEDVHRIKVDEKRGIVMATHKHGGLIVRDLDTDEILWALPRTYVRQYAHLEYGDGFLVFDRFGQDKEVWRLAAEYDESPAPPEELQQMISYRINKHIPKTKGSFKPWAVLTPPEFSRAYRMVYPNLLVVGAENAYVWNVLTCELVQAIHDVGFQRIYYAELSPLHVVICGDTSIRFFDRQTGEEAFCIRSNPWSPTDSAEHRIMFDFSHNHTRPTSAALRVVHLTPACEGAVIGPTTRLMQFIAVHTSPDGKTIAALTSDGRLAIIKDVLSVSKGQRDLLNPKASIILNLCEAASYYPQHTHGVYLAFEHGRIGVITTSGVFIVTLDTTEHNLVGRDEAIQQRLVDLKCDVRSRRVIANSPFPYIRCCQVLPFQNESLLAQVTCLQMTKTKMLFTYSPEAMPGSLYDPPYWTPDGYEEGDDDVWEDDVDDDEEGVFDFNAPWGDEDLEEEDDAELVPVRVPHRPGNETVIACIRFADNVGST